MANLITLEEYKEFLGITSTTDDQKLDSLIISTSALIKTYCARTFIDFYSVDKVETISIDYETKSIQLDEFPVISITKVEERTGYNIAYTELTDTAFEYYLDSSTDSVLKTDGGAGYAIWAKGPGAVRVTYKGGFLEAPADLKLAAMDLVTYYHKSEYKGASTLRGASKNPPNTTSQWGNVSFPDHIKRVLDLYKNI